MGKWYALTKIQLIDFASRYTQQLNIKSRVLRYLALLLPLLLVLPLIFGVYKIFSLFEAMGVPQLTITYVYVSLAPLMLVLSMPLIISLFFYAKDLQLLASLPIPTRSVLWAKLSVVYFYLLAMSICLLGAAVGFYVTRAGVEFSIISLVMGILALICAPIVPMVISLLVIMPTMGLIAKKRMKKVWLFVGNILLLVFIFGMQALLTRMEMKPDQLQTILSDPGSLLYLIGAKFPLSIWLTQMVQGQLAGLFLFIGCQGIALALVALLGRFVYQGALFHYQEADGGSGKNTQYKVVTQSPYWRLVRRHIGIVINNPTFLLQSTLSGLIPIIMFVVMTATGEMNLSTFSSPQMKPYVFLIFLGVIISPTLVQSLSATVITREGKTFWETRVLPISAELNLKTRIHSSLYISGFSSLILVVGAVFVLPLSALDLALGILCCGAVTLLLSTVDIFINIERPFITWTNPTAAVKNNLNITLALVLRMALMAVGYLGLFAIDQVLGFSEIMTSPLWLSLYICVLSILGYGGVKVLLMPKYLTKFTKMEI